jgi:large subunit ribosomal protein L42
MAFLLVKYKSGISNVGKEFWPLRQASSSRKLEEQITVTDDGSTIVCWLPEPRFPYECSRPLPPEQETQTTLKIQSLDEVRSVFVENKQEFVR